MSREDFRAMMADVIRRSRALLSKQVSDHQLVAGLSGETSRFMDGIHSERRMLDEIEREMANE